MRRRSIVLLTTSLSIGIVAAVSRIGLEAVGEWIEELWSLVAPGGKLHPTAFLEHKGHLFVESILLVAILYLVLLPRSKPKHKDALTEQEVEELCQEWTPEPLVPEGFDAGVHTEDLIIESRVEKYVTVQNRRLLNMGSTDFLGLLSNSEIEKACCGCIEQYGVGSCGPRAFYGTTNAHLKLEEHIAEFMGSQEAIFYSFDMCTVPSVLPAFANRKDIIVIDELVHYPIQTGCQLSRAQIRFFKHNDMEDLERILQEVDRKHRREKKPLNRRFIIVEGIYHRTGDVALLNQISQLKAKYKYRLIVDESLALGVLGHTGRGACEEFGLGPGDVDLITASVSNAVASIGGFCAGDHEIVGHQRLNGYGYIFSASLPPFLAAAADIALSQISARPILRSTLRSNANHLRDALSIIPGLQLLGNKTPIDRCSPVLHLTLADEGTDECKVKLRKLTSRLRHEFEILVTVQEATGLEWDVPKPTLKCIVTATHTIADLNEVVGAIKNILSS